MGQIRTLTALRFVAALVVVLCHLDILAKSPSPTLSGLYKGWFSEGFIGVTFFFVLSGFILSYATWGKKGGGVQIKRFYVNRFARIYPLHFLTFLLSLPLVWVTARQLSDWETWGGLLANLSLLQAFMPFKAVYFSVNHPSWSLSVEFFFYALFPFLFASRTGSLLVLLGVGYAYHLALALAWGKLNPLVTEQWQYLAYVFPPARLVDFVSGILIYRLRKHQTLSAGLATSLQIASLACLLGQIGVANKVSMVLRSDIFYLPVMTFLVYAFSFENGWLGRRLAIRPIVYLGEVSFSLYMVHQLVIRYGEYLMAKLTVPDTLLSGLVFSGIVVVVSLILSVLLYERVELPAKSWLGRRLYAV